MTLAPGFFENMTTPEVGHSETYAMTLEIVSHYLDSFLSGNEMASVQLENIALFLQISPYRSISKEILGQLLHQLCSNVKELLGNTQKLRLFNIFLARVEFGLPIPVEFAIGVLIQNPLVLRGKLSPDVAAELEITRQLCESLLQCRRTLFKKVKLLNTTEVEQASTTVVQSKSFKKSPTPPISIHLDETLEPEVIVLTDNDEMPEKTSKKRRFKSKVGSNPIASVPRRIQVEEQTQVSGSSMSARPSTFKEYQNETLLIDYNEIYAADPQFKQDAVDEESIKDSSDESQSNLLYADEELIARVTEHRPFEVDSGNAGQFPMVRNSPTASKKKRVNTDNLADLF